MDTPVPDTSGYIKTEDFRGYERLLTAIGAIASLNYDSGSRYSFSDVTLDGVNDNAIGLS